MRRLRSCRSLDTGQQQTLIRGGIAARLRANGTSCTLPQHAAPVPFDLRRARAERCACPGCGGCGSADQPAGGRNAISPYAKR